jgi:hypothetical protein
LRTKKSLKVPNIGHSNSTPTDAAQPDYAKCHCRIKEENGKQQELEYSYPEYYDIADFFNEANIAFTTDPQNTGFWLTLLGTLGPIVLIILFFILFMSADHEASDPTCSGKTPRYNQTYAPILWKF